MGNEVICAICNLPYNGWSCSHANIRHSEDAEPRDPQPDLTEQAREFMIDNLKTERVQHDTSTLMASFAAKVTADKDAQIEKLKRERQEFFNEAISRPAPHEEVAESVQGTEWSTTFPDVPMEESK